jgi:E3 ubiquitin-protein ligase MYCBP2
MENEPDNVQLSCAHVFPYQEIVKEIEKQFAEEKDCILCPTCSRPLTNREIEAIHPEYVPQLRHRVLKSFGEVVIRECPACKFSFVYEEGQYAAIWTNVNGKPISREGIECIRVNRATCPLCSVAFCTSCGVRPFHDGYTCVQAKLLNEGSVCRFCREPVDHGVICCDTRECKALLSTSCDHENSCGHPCCGIKGETTHIPCGICEGLICCYCADGLYLAPSIKLGCGHYTHMRCLASHIESCRPAGAVKLPKCGFPGCDAMPEHTDIRHQIAPWLTIQEKLDEMIQELLRPEGIETDPRIQDPKSEFYQDPLKLGRQVLRFYRCSGCGAIVYGGRIECGDANREEDDDYLCRSCNRNCASTCWKHGDHGMIFKCRNCCRPAKFLCFGTHHFCERCHNEYAQGHSVVYPCKGYCQFHPHRPNGSAGLVGYCSICESTGERFGLFCCKRG